MYQSADQHILNPWGLLSGGCFSTFFSLLLPFPIVYIYIFFSNTPNHELLIIQIYLKLAYILCPFGGPQTNVLSKIMSPPKPVFTASVGMQA